MHAGTALETAVELMKPGHPDNIRLAAAREVLDRGFGRPQVSVDLKADVATTSLNLFADISPADQRLASEVLGAVQHNPDALSLAVDIMADPSVLTAPFGADEDDGVIDLKAEDIAG